MTLDDLIVRLTLDVTGFTAGQKAATDSLDKTGKEAVKSAKAIEASAVSASQGVEKLARQFLGLYALLTGGRELKQFLSDITAADAAVGRTAKNIDMSGKALSTWQGVAVAAGGSAEGITGSMAGLSNAMQTAALTGENKLAPVFRALGINLATTGGKARDVGAIMFDLNRRYNEMHLDPARFSAMMKMVGMDDGTINLLERSQSEFRKLYTEQQKYAATAEDIDAAQKRQTGWRELILTSSSLGRTIATALTPVMVDAMKGVQGWASANQEWIKSAIVEKVGEFVTWLRSLDWNAIGKGAQEFGREVLGIATALRDTAKEVGTDSALFKAFEVFGALLLGGKVLGAINTVTAAVTAFGRLPVPPVLGSLLLNPAVLGTAAVGAVLASGDPNKALLSGGHPDVQPQDNDLGLPGTGEPNANRENDTTRPKGVLDWIKANAMPDFGKAGEQFKAFLKATGFGDRLHEDPRTKDNIEDTAKATKETRDILKRQADAATLGGGVGGVTASSGGLGGSGHHADGTSSPGASPRDRQYHGKGHYGEKGWWTPERQSHAVDVLMKDAGLTEDGAKALVSRWKNVESAGGPTAVNPKSGAAGIAQGLGSRRAGYTGTFDEQLKNAARELNGPEGRAKRMLNTPGMEATGASQFERAEGYNARTGRDNFTDRTQAGMGSIAHSSEASNRYAAGGEKPTGATVTVNGTPSHSDAPIGDQAALDAQRRITSGKGRAGDRELIEQHRQQQNTPAQPIYTKEQYDAAKRVAEVAKHVDMSKATADQRRAVGIAGPIITAYEKEHPQRSDAPTTTHVQRGKPLPSWMTPGADGPILIGPHWVVRYEC